MKTKSLLLFIILSIFILLLNITAKSVEEYLTEANELAKSGKLDDAVSLLEKASMEYPDSSSVYTSWGILTGQKAGQSKDLIEAGTLSARSFALLDKAIEIDPKNVDALLWRGIMGVNVPVFMAKLKGAIRDLAQIEKLFHENIEGFPMEVLITGYRFLAIAYEKDGQMEKAYETWKKIDEFKLDSDIGKEAGKKLQEMEETGTAKLSDDKTADHILLDSSSEKNLATVTDSYLEQAQIHRSKMEYAQAAVLLRKLVNAEPDNIEAYKILAETLAVLAEGYDKNIYSDANYRTALAFEILDVFDNIVKLDPSDLEMLLTRGIIRIQMPFFVGRLDEGIEDLQSVLKSTGSTEELRSEALYWIGFAYQKKSITFWNKIVKEYTNTKAEKMVFNSMIPGIKRINPSSLEKPVLLIDFILGFIDELEPQTAIWVENKEGEFIKTIYVSGFAGFVREKQITLSQWAESSKFIDADAITSASINMGHHIYTWDLKDHNNESIKNGEYIVRLEVFYWPSMKYHLISSPVVIGSEKTGSIIEKGSLVPYFSIEYYPK